MDLSSTVIRRWRRRTQVTGGAGSRVTRVAEPCASSTPRGTMFRRDLIALGRTLAASGDVGQLRTRDGGRSRHPSPARQITADDPAIGRHRRPRRPAGSARPPGRARPWRAERFIRTLKENLLWVRGFNTIDDLRQALHQFKDTYNRTWIVERHGYRTPAQVRVHQLGLAEAA